MGILSLSFWAVWVVGIVAAQPKTATHEVVAIEKIIDQFNLRSKLNFTDVDPCTPDATWVPESANPRVQCVCSNTVCHITHLKIYALDISGKIPQELFLLTELEDLNLGQNVLNGSLSPAIGKLSKMKYMTFGINNLTGPLPAELGNLTKLLSLGLSSNHFEGTLPPELGNLTSLQQLYIDSSGVNGPFPHSLSNLKNLQILWASDNGFTRKIPEFLGSLTGFKVLRLEGTNLEGPIPSSFGALTKLEDLRIGDISGRDSSLDFLENLTSLSILSLRNCRIAGQIPEKLSSFAKLTILELSFNKLTGQIPTSFKDFASLKYLYLGSNRLNGDLPSTIIGSTLIALDVSFNNLSGNISLVRKGISINVIGTSIKDSNLNNKKAASLLYCLQESTESCNIKDPSTSFAINCGGPQQVSAEGIKFDNDSETLGASSYYTSPNNQWAVSSAGLYISNPNGPVYIAQTDSQITNTLDSELHKTARISPNSLRYYGLGLLNGLYQIELHFAEIQMDDLSSVSWKGLGRRLFDVYIQGARVLQDFNILNEAGGSKKALVKKFEANVTNSVMDIHLFWAGKGTCCIPFQSTFGPLISSVQVFLVSDVKNSSKSSVLSIWWTLVIAIGCAAGLLILCLVLYLWWMKNAVSHTNTQNGKE